MPTPKQIRRRLDQKLAKLARLGRGCAALSAERAEAVAAAVAPFEDEINRLTREASELEAEIRDLAAEHQDALLAGENGRTAQLTHGSIQYRTSPPSLLVSSTLSTLTSRLKQLGYDEAVVQKPSLNKRWLLSHPEVVDAVSDIEIVRKTSITITAQ